MADSIWFEPTKKILATISGATTPRIYDANGFGNGEFIFVLYGITAW
jgi:hypothetical protein